MDYFNEFTQTHIIEHLTSVQFICNVDNAIRTISINTRFISGLIISTEDFTKNGITKTKTTYIERFVMHSTNFSSEKRVPIDVLLTVHMNVHCHHIFSNNECYSFKNISLAIYVMIWFSSMHFSKSLLGLRFYF